MSPPSRRALGELPRVLDDFPAFRAALGEHPPALFLDYDGTVAPIAARPELAVLDARARETLRRAAERLPLSVISGRDREDVERLVGLARVSYAGNHGLDIRTRSGRAGGPEPCAQDAALLAWAGKALEERLASLPGVQVEKKRLSLAVHTRNADASGERRAERTIAALLAERHGLRRKDGKRVIEIAPHTDWDKGRAVLWLLDDLERRCGPHAPLYIGDDITDEDAFAVLRELGRGVGVVVAGRDADHDRPSAAAWRVDGPDEVLRLLDRLLSEFLE